LHPANKPNAKPATAIAVQNRFMETPCAKSTCASVFLFVGEKATSPDCLG
jgi:hypothetical protein